MTTVAPLDTTIEVVTPENIAFNYQLAGPFRRIPAYLLDLVVRLILYALLMLMIFIAMGILGISVRTSFPFAFAAALALILYFLQSWFYGAFMETYYNGRTVGKWAFGLRVTGADGRPITGLQAILRNLLRDIDLMPPAIFGSLDAENPYLMLPLMTGSVGLVSMMLTRRMQRLGDLAAGTMVVIDERNWRLPTTRVDDLRIPALASYIPADFRPTPTMAKALAGYAERRNYLSVGRRREIAKHLATPLIERFEFRSDIDPDLLLFAMYYRTFLVDPAATAVDLGPLAGFTPLAKDQPTMDSLRQETAVAGGHAI